MSNSKKNSDYFLKKAEYFNQMAQLTYSLTDEYADIENREREVDNDDAYNYEDVIDFNTNNDIDPVKLMELTQIINSKIMPITNAGEINKRTLKSVYGRHYDPLTKRFYREDRKVNDEMDLKKNKTKPRIIKQMNVRNKDGIWYPENDLSFNIIQDIKTGKFYKITKEYDKDGKFSYIYEKLRYRPEKKIGTDFYMPRYLGK